jgi:hypothetical protein
VLAPARLCAAQQRGHDAIAGIETCSQIRDGDANLDRRPVTLTGDVHQAKLGFDHDIVASTIRVRARLTISGDGGVYQAGVYFAQRLVVQRVLLQRAGQVVLDEDVAFCHELVQNVNALFVLEGEPNRLFVPVHLDRNL